MGQKVTSFWSLETRLVARKPFGNGRKWPPGHRSLFDFGVRRVADKRLPAEVDRAEVERDVEAKRQARKQRE
jgi:hypothetical protein